MSDVKISVIVPVYNVEEFLEESIECVISQKNFLEIELILIDDGSTDDSGKIINKYKNKYKNIYGYFQKNSGQSAARNKGINHAQGEYIYFLDSDDLIPNYTLDYLLNLANKEDLDLILFEGESFFDESADSKKIEGFDYTRNKEYRSIQDGKKMFIEMMNNKDFFASPCLQFFKKDILLKHDISFLEGHIHEDELFSYQLLLSSDRVKCIKKQLFFRRLRSNSTITSNNYEKRIFSLKSIIEETIKFNKRTDTSDSSLNEALNKRINHLLGQCIIYSLEMKYGKRRKMFGFLKQIETLISKNGYDIFKKYRLYFKSPELYRVMKKTLNSVKS